MRGAWSFEVSECPSRGDWSFEVSECPPLPPVSSDSVQRDKIGEIVSSIFLKGFQKFQITRLFSIPFIITYMTVEWGVGGTL